MTDQRLIDDLLVGAVEVLPEGVLQQKLDLAEREGRPLRVKLGVDPTGSGPPPRSHRRPEEAAPVPGRRATRPS